MAKEFYTEDFVKENTYETPNNLRFKDITGNTYEKVKVISWAGNTIYGNWKRKRSVWWCKCDCGETDYFLVDRSSLEKGLTTSCGCNYKNNKGGHSSYSIEEVSKNIDSRYTILEYNGKRKPCKVRCEICNDVVEEKSFYSVQQKKLVCSCKDLDYTEAVRDNIEQKYNYKVLSRKLDTNTKGYLYTLKCNSCGVELEKLAANIKSKCPCHEMSSGKSAVGVSAVYLLRDEKDKSLYKIGKSVDPYARCEDINTSARKEGYDHKFSIIGVKWFASEQVSYYVENLYHQYFKDKAYYGFKGESNRDKTEFSGACETFTLDREDFIQFNKVYKSHIDFLQTEGVNFAIDKPFLENVNKLKKFKSVNIFIPHRSKFLSDLGLDILKTNIPAKKIFNEEEDIEKIIEKLSNLYYSINNNKYKSVDSFLNNLNPIFKGNQNLLKNLIGKVRHFTDEYELEELVQQELKYRELNHKLRLKAFIIDNNGDKISLNHFIRKEGLALTVSDIQRLLKEGKDYNQIVEVGGYFKVCPLVYDGSLISINKFIDKYDWKVTNSYLYKKLSELLNNHGFCKFSEEDFKSLSEKFLTEYRRG